MSKPPGHKLKKSAVVSKKTISPSTQNTLHHLAFDHSIQANIIFTVSTGRITAVNDAACKLLNYSKRELLTKGRASIFDINEDSFKKMMGQRAVDGYASGRVMAIKKGGKQLPCEITSAVFIDEDGIEKSITTIADMSQSITMQKAIDVKKEKIVAENIITVKSKQKKIDLINKKIVADNIVIAKSKQTKIDAKKEKIIATDITIALAKADARLAENNKWIKYISEASYDVMWDWDIITDEIYVGDSIEEVFGYTVQKNIAHFKDFSRILLPEEKGMVEKKLLKALSSNKKSWNDSYKLKRFDGSVAATTSRGSIVRDEEGKAIRLIGATQDVSRQRELEKKLEEQITIQEELSEIFQTASELSFDGIWDWNLLTNEFFLGKGFEELFGYDIKNNKGDMAADWSNYLHPEDKEGVENGLQEAIMSSDAHWEHTYRFVKADGSIAKVFNRASIIRNADGKAYRIIGAMQDISKQRILEERLEQEVRLKEKEITEAAAEARKTERSDIGKELHDNVNQLLGASRLYLNMAKGGGDNSEMFLSRSSEYTLTAIEEIRKLTKELTTDAIKNLGLCDAITNVASDAMEVNPVIICCALENAIEPDVSDKFKLNIFRIVQEQLNNILKHAHATEVTITLSQDKKFITLAISDNGIGFDTGEKRKGIGISNIKSRAVSYKGIADFVSQPGNGCVLTVTFPKIKTVFN